MNTPDNGSDETRRRRELLATTVAAPTGNRRPLPFTRIATFAWMLIALLGFSGLSSAETVRLYFDPATPQIAFAAGDIKAALESQGHTVQTNDLSAYTSDNLGRQIVLAVTNNTAIISSLLAQGGSPVPGLGEQAYALRTTTNSYLNYWAVGADAVGAMYGGFQIAENISFNGLSAVYNTEETPYLLNRGMKLNMAFDRRLPTYAGWWTSTSAMESILHVWDITFWKTLIDQQARSRYNVLTVWEHHPFPAMVRVPEYPNACLPRIEGFNGVVFEMNHEQRVAFWREVMKYAHDRGMKFYLFNWNIHIEYAKDQYPALTETLGDADTIDYMYKSMRALLETYPELDGFGITSGDGMTGGDTGDAQWTWHAMGKAVYDHFSTNTTRKFNLIHRSTGTSPDAWNIVYAPLDSLPNVQNNYSAKYAMAHMYASTAPRWSADTTTIKNLGKKTWLTLRNDDFFYLNWGDPQFVREFMTGMPFVTNGTIAGMYIGSDGYNPSRTYFCRDESQNGQLEVQRRWYMEMLWGRLSYNTNTSDNVLKNLLGRHYALAVSPSTNLFNAWTLASRSLPKVTELIMKNWNLDFHWYPEGCWSDPARCGGFRTISDVTGDFGGFAGQDVASGSPLCKIATSATGGCDSKKSSYTLADEMQADAESALALINNLSSGGNPELAVAINNVKQMAYLSLYYAHKIRGATYKKAGDTATARDAMGKAYWWWIIYSRAMSDTYYTDSFRNLSLYPDWKFGDEAVLKEYTDLGGVGLPPMLANTFTFTTSAPNGTIALNPSAGVYLSNTVVTVTANANFGYAFASWSGDLSGAANPTTITMTGNKSVTAYFIAQTNTEMAPWIETFTMADGSKMDGPPTSWQATRSNGVFQVSGNRLMVNGEGSPGVLETAEINISAGSVKVSLDVQISGSSDAYNYVQLFKIVDGGSPVLVDQVVGEAVHPLVGTNIVGSKLKLRVVAQTSWSNKYYYLDNLKVEYETPVTLFTVTPSATNGTIVLNPSGGIYPTGTEVAATAVPNIGFGFGNWSGDLTGSVNPTTITVNGNKNITANFVPVATYTLTTTGSITVNPLPSGGVYNAGTVVTLTANPMSGYAFSQWSGALSGSVNPTTITMNGNKTVTANYVAVPTYTLAASAPKGGSVAVNPPPMGGLYNAGTVVTLTAVPRTGYTFTNWSGDLGGSVNPTTLTMNANQSVAANFFLNSGNRVPWGENFNSLPTGATSHGPPTTWTATRGGPFMVSTNRFIINDAGGEGVFTTDLIDIFGRTVNLSLDVQSAGGVDSGDYLKLFIRTNGGPETLVNQAAGGQAATTWMLNGITGNDLQIVIRASVSWVDEFYYWDNLMIADAGPAQPTVTVSATDSSAAEPADNGQFTFTRSGSVSGDLTVNCAVTGTATNGLDYTILGTTITIPNGSSSVTLPVNVIDDALLESTETVIVTLSSGTGYTIGLPGSATVNVADNEVGPSAVSISASLPNAAEPNVNGQFTINRGTNTIGALLVNFTVTGTATGGTDYTNIGTAVTIPNGSSSVTIPVYVSDDILVEGVETVIVTLGSGTGYTIGSPSNATVNIADNEMTSYTLTTSALNGSITLNPPGGVYNSNTVVTVTAVPNTGFTFGSWSGDLTGSANPTTITMNGNKSITANIVVPSGSALSRTGWVVTASVSNVSAPPTNAIDGNLTTRWATGTKQANGQWFQIDMISAQTFNRIVLDAGSYPNDYPRGYQVNVSSDGLNWGTPVATGVGTNVTTISFATQTARYIRVTQTGSVISTIWWSTCEVNVYAPAVSGPPPVLVPALQAGQLRLEWVGGGTLQTATSVAGPWSDITNALSPYLHPTTNSAQFFRVKQ